MLSALPAKGWEEIPLPSTFQNEHPVVGDWHVGRTPAIEDHKIGVRVRYHVLHLIRLKLCKARSTLTRCGWRSCPAPSSSVEVFARQGFAPEARGAWQSIR